MATRDNWIPVYIRVRSSTRSKLFVVTYVLLAILYVLIVLITSVFAPVVGVLGSFAGIISFVLIVVKFLKTRGRRLGAEMMVESAQLSVKRPGRGARSLRVLGAEKHEDGSLLVMAAERGTKYQMAVECVYEPDIDRLFHMLKSIASPG